jgi:hypothetical protein
MRLLESQAIRPAKHVQHEEGQLALFDKTNAKRSSRAPEAQGDNSIHEADGACDRGIKAGGGREENRSPADERRDANAQGKLSWHQSRTDPVR